MKTFEELPVWRAERALAREIYRLCRSIRDRGFCDQLQRAVSICSNVAEGHERGSAQGLLNFLFIAKGSAGEVRSQLYHAEDPGHSSAEEADRLRKYCVNINSQLSAWIQAMRTGGFRGGLRYHKELDRSLERIFDTFGLEQQVDGTFEKVRAPQRACGKRETENRKTEI